MKILWPAGNSTEDLDAFLSILEPLNAMIGYRYSEKSMISLTLADFISGDDDAYMLPITTQIGDATIQEDYALIDEISTFVKTLRVGENTLACRRVHGCNVIHANTWVLTQVTDVIVSEHKRAQHTTFTSQVRRRSACTSSPLLR